jgi:hypothetical protein
MGGEMRLLPGFCGALLLLAIGAGEAMAACCYTAPPVHVYVPPPTHVVIIPHTTYVHPVTTTRVNPRTSTGTVTNASTPQTVHTKPHPHVVQTVVVDNQTAPTGTGCKRQQAGQGCKKQKDDEQTGWATVRRWLQIGKQ